MTANEILAGAALREGKFIKAFPEFGPERMGAPIKAFCRISDKPINVHSQVYTPDFVVVLDFTLIGKVDLLGGIKEGGKLVANFAGSLEELREVLGNGVELHRVNATQIAMEEIGRPMANTAMVGALVSISEVVELESVLAEVESKFSAKFSREVVEKNLMSVRRAYEEVE